MQNHAQRMEYVVKGNEVLVKGQESDKNEILGKAKHADLAAAQVEIGEYEEGIKKKKKKKKRVVEDPDGNEDQEEEEQVNRKHPDIEEVGEDGYDNIEGNYLNQQEKIPANKKKSKDNHEDPEHTEPSSHGHEAEEHSQSEDPEGKKKKSKKKKKDDSGENDHSKETPDHDKNIEEAKIHRKESKKEKKESKSKRKEEILRIKNQFMEKLISPFTDVDELVEMFMKPLPKEVGILE